ncbi:hypothetical protein Csa_003351 [Cucumis sativus]|uniref:Phytosulfokine n=1 Tax=Cucumis sativus TaxID=3659 RepID=A0A0A0KLK0_CUCSA|nr:hypothetical protein Csa_003351 [Cucumis sativus]
MPSKFFSFLFIFFLLLLLHRPLAYAARPTPAAPTTIPTQELAEELKQSDGEMVMDENCDGVGEEECLMRRTLAAHLDYVYTQKHKP